jgi:integrase
VKLTKTVVDRVEPPASGQRFIRDDILKGFALRVTSGGARSFVVEARVHGRVRRKTLGRYGPLTVEQARRAAQQYLGQVASGADPVAEERAARARRVTLREALDDYIAVRKGLKPNTVHDYRRHLTQSFPDWADRPLASIRKDAVAARHEKLGERSPARANNAMRVLRALFNFARGQYEGPNGETLFPDNPVERLSHTRAWYRVERRRTLISRTQLPAWFDAVESLRRDEGDPQAETVADLLLLLLFTGLRRSEGMMLKWSDVDLAERTLRIHDTKNREPLTLPLPDFLHELLERRQAKAVGPFVFPGNSGYGHLVEPRSQMLRVTERSGVSFTLHDLRRTFVTVAESLDIPYYAIKQLVNHKAAGDVTAGYIITNFERLRVPMQRITDELLSVAGGRKPGVVMPFGREAKA